MPACKVGAVGIFSSPKADRPEAFRFPCVAKFLQGAVMSEIRDLKIRAQALKPTIRLGRSGVTPEFLAAFSTELDRLHLVKLRFEDFKEKRKTVARDLAEKTGSQLVQQVGHTAVFFRLPPASRS
jgi:RNA-binding protein